MKKTNEKLKIGFLGVNFVTKHLLNELTKIHDVVAWNRTETDQPFSQYIKLNICDVPWMKLHFSLVARGLQTSLPFYFKGLMPSLWKEKPNVLVVMDYFRLWFLQALIYALFHPKVKLIIHTETKRPPKLFPARVFFYAMTAVVWIFQWRIHFIITYSEAGTMYLKKMFPFIKVGHLALPIDEHTPQYNKVTAGDTIRLLMPARFVDFKRHKDIIIAMESVSVEKDLQIDFATFEGDSSPVINSLRDRLEISTAKSRIKFRAPIKAPFSNYYDLLAEYDGIILPSENEGLGAVVPAALRCGRIAITSDTVGANIYMDETLQKYQFKTSDALMLSKLLANLSKNQIESDNIYAAKLMREKFDSKSVADKFLEIINE